MQEDSSKCNRVKLCREKNVTWKNRTSMSMIKTATVLESFPRNITDCAEELSVSKVSLAKGNLAKKIFFKNLF